MSSVVKNIIVSKEAFEKLVFIEKLQEIIAYENISFFFCISEDELFAELTECNDYPSSVILEFFNSYSVKNPISFLDFNKIDQEYTPSDNMLNSIIIAGNDVKMKEKFKNDFGINWILESEIDENIFNYEFEKVTSELKEIENNCDWQEITKGLKKYAINALFINDRNLFSNEYNAASFRGDKDFKNSGVENIKIILEELLPYHLKIPFQILICSEQKTDERYSKKVNNAIEDLSKFVKSLRDYPIELEFILYNSGTKYFSNTHNRRILLNFHFGKVEHGFDLFKYLKKMKIENRDDCITLSHLFLKKSSRDNYFITLKRFYDICNHAKREIENTGQSNYTYKIFSYEKFSVILKNRLFLAPPLHTSPIHLHQF